MNITDFIGSPRNKNSFGSIDETMLSSEFFKTLPYNPRTHAIVDTKSFKPTTVT